MFQKAYEISPEKRAIQESYDALVKENSLRFVLLGNSLDFSSL
ncbi:hypothetical protein [Oligoflexus tunisiensis]|nr:hypothetical protein [Oligoflexus tunisiensis]